MHAGLERVALCMQGTPEGVEDNGSLTRVAAFPIGIDPERFAQALEKPSVKAHIAQLLNRYAGRKVYLLLSSHAKRHLLATMSMSDLCKIDALPTRVP